MSKINRIKELILLCNKYRDAYYNHQPIVTDEVYDRYFDELSKLEQETNCYFVNSPTQSVGYEVADTLPKVVHDIPLLSLDKTKSVEDVVKFEGDKDVLTMIKGDGLTTKLVYKSDGEYAKLIEASTRGNGEVGSLVTHNVKTFVNVPLKIKYNKDLTVVGESVIYKEDLDIINATLPEDEQYANCRNLASGSLSLLDSQECAKRHMRFLLFDVIKGMDEINSLYERFKMAADLGFDVIYHYKVGGMGVEEFTDIIADIHEYADKHGIPCDGVVIRYDDYSYGTSLGRTGHHYRYGIAKKEEDDLEETIFRGIEWNTSRNGIVYPIGLFDEVTILDSRISRATLHNLNYIDELKLRIGDRICISKRNMVIPAIEVNLDYDANNYQLPLIDTCPSCGEKLIIKNTGTANVLYCPNEDCPSRKSAKFAHFVSRKGANIDGLSERTIEVLIFRGFINSFKDIYHLSNYKEQLTSIDGLGEKSVNTLLKSIENSRNIKLENFIASLSIPNIGATASKTIAKYCCDDVSKFFDLYLNGFDWTELDAFGDIMANNINKYLNAHFDEIKSLADEFLFIVSETPNVKNSSFDNIKFCITGSFSESREILKRKIEALGAKFTSSVSKNTDILFCGENAGSKLEKAKALNVRIVYEEELLKLLNN